MFFQSSYYFLYMCGKLFNGPDWIHLFLCNYLISVVINENFHFQTMFLIVFNKVWALDVHFAVVHSTALPKPLPIIFSYYFSGNTEHPVVILSVSFEIHILTWHWPVSHLCSQSLCVYQRPRKRTEIKQSYTSYMRHVPRLLSGPRILWVGNLY